MFHKSFSESDWESRTGVRSFDLLSNNLSVATSLETMTLIMMNVVGRMWKKFLIAIKTESQQSQWRYEKNLVSKNAQRRGHLFT